VLKDELINRQKDKQKTKSTFEKNEAENGSDRPTAIQRTQRQIEI
jgi:hypothetical protein